MIREHPRGGRLEVRVYAGKDPITKKERYRSRIVPGTGRDARRRAKEVEAGLIAEIRRARPTGADGTVDELLDRWLAIARHEPSTRARMDPQLKKHIRARIGPVPVRALTREHIDQLYLMLERDAGLAPSSVLRLHRMLHAALEQAVVWEWIDRNPARGAAQRLDVANAGPTAPPAEAVAALMAAAWAQDPDFACFVRVGAATGMRRGEVCALRRSDLALDQAALRKTRAIGDAGGRIYEKQTKTGTRHALALDAGTVVALRDQLSRVEARAMQLDTRLIADPFVFTWAPDGSKPWRPDWATKRLARLRGETPGAEGVTLRSLRHFVTTTLLEGGASITTVTARGGWSRPTTPLGTYAAFLPAGDRDAADIMGRVLDG